MKNISLLLLAAALTSPVFALTWTDPSPGSPPLIFLQGTNGSSFYNNNFIITDNGYNPANHVVTSFTATFQFADDWSGNQNTPDSPFEYVDIYLNGFKAISGLEVDGLHSTGYASYTVTVTGSGVSGPSAVGNATDANNLIAALQDGTISYKVQLTNGANGGDTYLKVTSLTATGNTRTVPDGGTTAAMLGLGLIGLAAASKRFGQKL